MLTSWSEVSTPAELSMASVLMRPPLQRVLDAAALREAEVGALADHLAAQLAAVDAHRVVGAVADLGVALAARLHVGADAAEVEQLDRRAFRMARISSARRQRSPPRCRSSLARLGESGIDLALRAKTPPPAEISVVS